MGNDNCNYLLLIDTHVGWFDICSDNTILSVLSDMALEIERNSNQSFKIVKGEETLLSHNCR